MTNPRCRCGHPLSLHKRPCRSPLRMAWQDFWTWGLEMLFFLLVILAALANIGGL